ncbi:Sodium/solute symporter [Kalmanozyma brasiliensis GHG001]|uniref:Sodium/solute symporter n=1 Tax=Kalmanozyma brasiliensis (strain GHG001) TaxID=1365824 RepID=UPI0028683659|nr:Sodium/solute symporter [Kalmanozyma brasiliensis GHG001]EST08814.2 Sodium/solute symporter [Kalmanozyma brasiliensis GHG001]
MVASTRVLPEGAGWAVVCGLGFFFAAFMIVLSFVQQRYTNRDIKDTDEFASASRSVKPGLVAAGICSAWTWSSTLLQSTAVTYKLGISGGYWYAGGATIQILLCSIMACMIKLNAPFCSTFLEVLRVRWGKLHHCVLLFFALATNLLVSSQLVVGGSAVATTLTGIPTLAAIWLIPMGVACYVLVGGMRATLLADYTHTVGLLIIIFYFFFKVWVTSPEIGSVSAMVELLQKSNDIHGNASGTPLTFRSLDGLVFGVINVIGNLGTVFCDQSYHQRSIASNPATAARAFLLGGSAWFAIPFLFSMTMGLSARGLLYSGNPLMPALSAADVNAGLAAPASGVALAGKGGAVAVLIILFLAVTSASSAQQVAVASVLTFDVYKPYVRPQASKREIFIMSHAGVVIWAIVMALFGTIFHYVGISLGWLYLAQGIIISPAVVPIFCGLCFKRTNKMACLVGMAVGLVSGVVVWLVTAATLEGEVTVASTGKDYPTLAGNCVSLFVSGIITMAGTLLRPETEDHFVLTRAINAPEEVVERMNAQSRRESTGSPAPGSPEAEKTEFDSEKKAPAPTALPYTIETVDYVKAAGLDADELRKTMRFTSWVSVVASISLCVIIPACLASRKTWDATGLAAYIWIGFVWLIWTSLAVGVLPVWESRHELAAILRGIGKDLTGKSGKYQDDASTTSS